MTTERILPHVNFDRDGKYPILCFVLDLMKAITGGKMFTIPGSAGLPHICSGAGITRENYDPYFLQLMRLFLAPSQFDHVNVGEVTIYHETDPSRLFGSNWTVSKLGGVHWFAIHNEGKHAALVFYKGESTFEVRTYGLGTIDGLYEKLNGDGTWSSVITLFIGTKEVTIFGMHYEMFEHKESAIEHADGFQYHTSDAYFNKNEGPWFVSKGDYCPVMCKADVEAMAAAMGYKLEKING